MPTNDEALTKDGRPRTRCAWYGCEASRKRYPSGQWSAWCPTHANEAARSRKARTVVDPVTGETVSRGILAVRSFRRRQAAKAGEGA